MDTQHRSAVLNSGAHQVKDILSSRRRIVGSGRFRAREHYVHEESTWVSLSDRSVSCSLPALTSQQVFVPSNAVLHALAPVIQDSTVPLSNCILLGSVLRVLCEALTLREERSFWKSLKTHPHNDTYVFLNEQCIECYVPQRSTQSDDDHLLTLVKCACTYLQRQFPRIRVSVCVLDTEIDVLTDLPSTVSTISVDTFLQLANTHIYQVWDESLSRARMIVEEFKARFHTATKGGKKRIHLPDLEHQPYWPKSKLQEGIKSGRVYTGVLHVHEHNPREGWVGLSTGADTHNRVLVAGTANLNRAISGDTVYVELLPRARWSVPSDLQRLTFPTSGADEENDAEGITSSEEEESAVQDNCSHKSHTWPSGRIVGLRSRNTAEYVCTVSEDQTSEYVIAVPVSKNIPKIRIRSSKWQDITGKRILVQLDDWPEDSFYPSGHYVSTLGDVGDWRVEVKALMHTLGLVHPPFSAAALACLPRVSAAPEVNWGSGWAPSEEEVAMRRDLRDDYSEYRVFSVDPPMCEDIDDAMSVSWVDGGSTLEVCVHIADVTYFIGSSGAETPIDRAALLRGTTVYLSHTRYDMLPGLLSSDVCSLHGNTDRFAMTVAWKFKVYKQKGGLTGRSNVTAKTQFSVSLDDELEFELCHGAAVWVGRTVIRSCAAMTYAQAHEILRTGVLNERSQLAPPGQAGGAVDRALWGPLRQDLLLLTHVSRYFRGVRAQGGALELSRGGGELKFKLDEDGEPVEIGAKEELEIHTTIAELMILANGTVAQIIRGVFPLCALLRKHPPPQDSKIELVNQLASPLGVKFNSRTAKDMQESLDAIAGLNNQNQQDAVENTNVTGDLITSLVIRAMNEAQYVCTGTVGLDSGVPVDAQQKVAPFDAKGQQTERSRHPPAAVAHYGLGLAEYTHFTSPIRRYADVVVHKQLLAAVAFVRWHDNQESLNGRRWNDCVVTHREGLWLNPTALPQWKEMKPAETKPRQDLTLPESETISTVSIAHGGDGVDRLHPPEPERQDQDSGDFLDDLLDDVTIDTEIGQVRTGGPSYAVVVTENKDAEDSSGCKQDESSSDTLGAAFSGPQPPPPPPYDASKLSEIAAHLNKMNRKARSASMECQKLFLRLYFRGRSETHTAIVYSIKENGVLVYIPKFDIKGPVYITSKSGQVHVLPSLVGLSATAGSPPEPDFQAGEGHMAFPCFSVTTRTETPNSDPIALEILSPEGETLLSLKVMQTVSVLVCSDGGSLRMFLMGVGRVPNRSSTKLPHESIIDAVTRLPSTLEATESDFESSIATNFPSKFPIRLSHLDVTWQDNDNAHVHTQSINGFYQEMCDQIRNHATGGPFFGMVTETSFGLDERSDVSRAKERARKPKPHSSSSKLQPRQEISRSRLRFHGYEPVPLDGMPSLFATNDDHEPSIEASSQTHTSLQTQVHSHTPARGWSQDYAELEELPGYGYGYDDSQEKSSSANISQSDVNRYVKDATARTQRLKAAKRQYTKKKG